MFFPQVRTNLFGSRNDNIRLMGSTVKGSNNEAMDGNDDGQHPGESHSSRANCMESGKEPPNINASEPD